MVTEQKFGSDLVVDLLSALGIEEIMANPGATTRGLHDSLVNGGPGVPSVVLCTNEGIAVAAAHGYAKATGRVGVALVHDLVGLLSGSMAIFNAFLDQVPVVIIGGTGPADAARRRPWIEWIHTASVEAQAVREFVKWDVAPTGLEELRDALVRAFRLAATPPRGPVYVAIDVALQEDPTDLDVFDVPTSEVRPLSLPAAPAGVVVDIAARLRDAAHPVVLAQRLGQDESAIDDLVRLAELVPVAVVDLANRLNFPTQHPSNASEVKQEVMARADVLLALDVQDLAAELERRTLAAGLNALPDLEVVRVSLSDYALSGWSAGYRQLAPDTAEVLAEPAGFLSDLVSVIGRSGRDDSGVAGLHADLAALLKPMRAAWRDEVGTTRPGDAITPAALAAALGDVFKKETIVLVNGSLRGWALRFWDLDRPRQWLGHSGGGGVGYGPGASLGAAVAHRDGDVICVNIAADGDFMYNPGALWTAAREGLPLLTVMFNNRSYYRDEEHQAIVAADRGRSGQDPGLGIRLDEPAIDFAALARALGVHAEGPISRIEAVVPAVESALEVVKAGGPALIDVVTTGR